MERQLDQKIVCSEYILSPQNENLNLLVYKQTPFSTGSENGKFIFSSKNLVKNWPVLNRIVASFQ
jgi:hypothetical protein